MVIKSGWLFCHWNFLYLYFFCYVFSKLLRYFKPILWLWIIFIFLVAILLGTCIFTKVNYEIFLCISSSISCLYYSQVLFLGRNIAIPIFHLVVYISLSIFLLLAFLCSYFQSVSLACGRVRIFILIRSNVYLLVYLVSLHIMVIIDIFETKSLTLLFLPI